MFYPECHCPEEQQQPTPQGEQTSEQNDPLTPPRRTDPPAGLPEMQPLAQAQAGTKASKEEFEKKEVQSNSSCNKGAPSREGEGCFARM